MKGVNVLTLCTCGAIILMSYFDDIRGLPVDSSRSRAYIQSPDSLDRLPSLGDSSGRSQDLVHPRASRSVDDSNFSIPNVGIYSLNETDGIIAQSPNPANASGGYVVSYDNIRRMQLKSGPSHKEKPSDGILIAS